MARARLRPRPGQPAAGVGRVADAPLGLPRVDVEGRGVVGREELADVDTDATGADDSHPGAGGALTADQLGVGHDHRVVDAGDGRHPGHDAGGDDDLGEAGVDELVGADLAAEVHLDPAEVEAPGEVADRLRELLLARDPHRDVELAAHVVAGLEQLDLVATVGQRRGGGEPGGPGTDHGHLLHGAGRSDHQLGLVRGARVHQAAGALVDEGVVEAGLVAGDAGVDLVGARLGGLADPLGVGEERPGQRDEVGASGEHRLGDVGHVDPVRRARSDQLWPV